MCVLIINNWTEKYVPPQPTTHANQWYHGTLNRAESERIFKHAKSALENEVNKIGNGAVSIQTFRNLFYNSFFFCRN